MRDDLLLYYERELTYIRQMAANFAERYPNVKYEDVKPVGFPAARLSMIFFAPHVPPRTRQNTILDPN